jgi:hypothetical protein
MSLNETLMLLATAVTLCSCASPGGAPPNAAPACPGWTASDYAAAPVIRRLRISTDPRTGDSALSETPLLPKRTPLMKTGQILLEYGFGAASKVQIVVGPPNLEIPLHPAPYRESFLILAGNLTMALGDGTKRELLPGDMTVFEDTDARIGHGGRTGSCGYVSLEIVP